MSAMHSSSNSNHWNSNVASSGEKKKKKIIKWDEEAIAEHDKERGSRQKIDEAPTPYRYLSESDQSEAESGSDGEFLSKSNNDNEEQPSNHSNFPHPGGKYGQNVLSDMWETVNAKLHYEKHLIDLREGGGATGSVFGEEATPSSVAVEDGYSDFGEPRASPRVNMKQASSSSHHHHHRFGNHNGSGEQLNEMSDTVSPTTRGGVKRGAAESSSERPHRACFAVGAADGSTSNDHLFAGINGSISSGCGFEFSPDRVESEAHRKEFLNQRAGHYNEFKVLKAMRAKLLEEDDEDD